MLRFLMLAWLVPSAATAMTDVDGSLAKLTDFERQLLASTLSFQLFDAQSAQIRDLRLTGSMKGCGLINARGAGGGFTGFRLFAVDLPRGELRAETTRGGPISRSEFGARLDPLCADWLLGGRAQP